MRRHIPSTKTLRLGAMLWASSGVAAVLALGTQMGMARSLAPAEYGEIASWLTICAVMGALGHFGLGNLLIRKHAENSANDGAWIRISVRLALGITVLISIAAALLVMLQQHAVPFGLLLLPVAYSYTFSELAIARQQLLENMRVVARLQCTPNFLRFVFAGMAMYAAGDAATVALALGAASALAAVTAIVGYCRKVPVSPGASPISVATALASTWPYGLSMAVYMAYSQGGVLLLRWLDSPESAGNFALAINVLAAVYLLPFAIFQRLNAKQVAKWSAGTSAQLRPYLKKVIIGSAVVGLGIALALAVAASLLIRLLFGADYTHAESLLSILGFAIPFRFVSTAAGATLNSHRDTQVRLRIQLAVFAVFVLLSWLAASAAPAHLRVQVIGAAFVACEGLLCALYVRAAWSRATLATAP